MHMQEDNSQEMIQGFRDWTEFFRPAPNHIYPWAMSIAPNFYFIDEAAEV